MAEKLLTLICNTPLALCKILMAEYIIRAMARTGKTGADDWNFLPPGVTQLILSSCKVLAALHGVLCKLMRRLSRQQLKILVCRTSGTFSRETFFVFFFSFFFFSSVLFGNITVQVTLNMRYSQFASPLLKLPLPGLTRRTAASFIETN